MAVVLLQSGDSITLGGIVEIFGTAGTQSVTIQDGSTITFRSGFNAGNQDTVRLTGLATSFNLSLSGSNAVLTSATDGISITIPVGASGTVINFDNGDTRVLIFDGTNVVLGAQVATAVPTVLDVNAFPPVITSNGGGATAAVSVGENSTAVTIVTSTDADAVSNKTFSLNGGADAALFQIGATTGALSFKAAPNFEAPADAGANNVYDVIVRVTDNGGLTDDQAIAVTVTDVNDAPVITSNGGGATAAVSVAENSIAVATVTSTDADAGATRAFSLNGGADAALFQIDAATGALSFKAAPNFEAPADAGANNVYDVIARVTDNGGLVDDQAIAVTVTDVNEGPPVITSNGGGATAAVSMAENSTAVTTVTSTDVDTGATRTFSLNGGADAALFQIDAATGALSFKAAPNFEAPTDAGANNVYDVIARVTDNGGLADDQAIAVTVTDVNEAPVITSNGGGATAAMSVAENSTAVTIVTSTDADAGATRTFSLNGGADAALFQIDAATGALSFKAAPNFEAPTDAGANNVYDVVVRVTDNGGLADDQAIAVTVIDVNDTPTDLVVATATFVSSGQGFRIFGADAGDYAGALVSSAGDINGDGFDDLIVGARFADAAGNAKSDAGEAIVVFGKAGGFGDIDVASPTFVSSGQGFRIFGAQAGWYAGGSVSSAGDINGDGFDDLIVGANASAGNGKQYGGEAVVVFGKAGGFADIDTGSSTFVSSGQGFRIFGADVSDFAGISVSSAGDINGDGFDDLIVGALGDGAGNSKVDAGEAILVFGKAGGFGDIDVAFVSSGQGFRIFGADARDYAGSVSSAGDINGDGFDDLIVGAPKADGAGNGKVDAGEAILVFGKAGGFGDVDVSSATFVSSGQGFRIFGADIDDRAGGSVSSAGDINGDGFDDLIVGAFGGDGAGNSKVDAGEAILVFGKAGGFGDVDVSSATFVSSGQGFRIFGADAGDRAASVSSAGDINGDGFDDLIVGAFGGDGVGNARDGAGEAVVVFGKAGGFGDIDVSSPTFVSSGQGFRIFGADTGDGAASVSSAGDINGDGFDDLIVGASYGDGVTGTKSSAGEAITVFGRDFLGTVVRAGTSGNDTLTGTSAAETFVGGQGNDVMTGNGGADVFRGGAGNDAIHLISASFADIDGGSGFDTVLLDQAGITLDFSAIRFAEIQGIEAIDLTGNGNNALKISKLALLAMSDDSAGGVTQLTVFGNSGDSVTALDSGWSGAGSTTIAGQQFNVYQNGAAHLNVQAGVTFG